MRQWGISDKFEVEAVQRPGLEKLTVNEECGFEELEFGLIRGILWCLVMPMALIR